jgi:hypothetical protein
VHFVSSSLARAREPANSKPQTIMMGAAIIEIDFLCMMTSFKVEATVRYSPGRLNGREVPSVFLAYSLINISDSDKYGQLTRPVKARECPSAILRPRNERFFAAINPVRVLRG